MPIITSASIISDDPNRVGTYAAPQPDGRPDYEALAVRADKQAEQAEALHLIALWRESATTYRELAHYHSFRPGDAEPIGFGNIPQPG